jgi:acyl-CoA thioesterase-1
MHLTLMESALPRGWMRWMQGLRHCKRAALRLATLVWTALLCLLTLAVGPAFAAPGPVPKPATVMVFGDSLSAEYGLSRGQGWVALTEARMKGLRWPVKVVNASLSGETTAGGLSRLPALLAEHRPTHVVIELGANDALRGLSVKVAQAQLNQLVKLSQAAQARVLLVGMMAPPNMGKRYGDDFARMYQQVSASTQAGLVPFMLQGVADRADARDWFQADGLHPLAKAHPIIRDTIWPRWQALLLGGQAGR